MLHVPILCYADTSVFGGCFDVEFSAASHAFFEEVRQKRFKLVASDILAAELQDAPARVRDYASRVLADALIMYETPEVRELQNKYLALGILTQKWEVDALHVAYATVADCRILVSWNFKHVVHFQKIPMYNGVNESSGYKRISIHSPWEVLNYAEEEL